MKLNAHFNELSIACTTIWQCSDTLFFEPTTTDEVWNVIHDMKLKKSRGLEEIPIQLLKYANEIIAVPFAHFINTSIQLGQFPDALKIGEIVLIYKKGDSSNYENFTPIVLLSYLSKVAEKVVSSRIYDFMESKKVFSSSQYGYRKHKSTELACINFTQKIYEYLDKGKKVASLLFDLTAAFDIVNHKFL